MSEVKKSSKRKSRKPARKAKALKVPKKVREGINGKASGRKKTVRVRPVVRKVVKTEIGEGTGMSEGKASNFFISSQDCPLQIPSVSEKGGHRGTIYQGLIDAVGSVLQKPGDLVYVRAPKGTKMDAFYNRVSSVLDYKQFPKAPPRTKYFRRVCVNGVEKTDVMVIGLAKK